MKKREYLTLLFCLLVCVGAPFGGNAQVCQPDPAYSLPGIYPDSLPNTCVNEPYATAVTLVIPSDTTIIFPFSIDSVVLNDVVGLPPGLNFQCEPPSCSFAGGTTSCVLVSGTPSVPGTYNIDIISTFHVFNLLSGPLAVRDTQTAYYTIVVHAEPSISVATTPANCNLADGSATVSATGAGPFTYLWSDGQTTAIAGNLGAGVYSVVVTDVNGCSITEFVTVPSNDLTLVQDSISWAGCAEDMGGAIYVSVSGGTGAYTYSWSNGSANEDLTGIASGNYTLTASDGNNCVVSDIFSITAPPPLTITQDSIKDLSCFGDNDGAIFTTVDGGMRGYTYAWDSNPVQMSDDATNLSGGDYTLTVTDNLGCVKVYMASVAEPDSFYVMIADTSETAAGAGDGTATATVMGGTGPYSYSWENGDSTSRLDSVSSGVYTLTITDANGCVLIDSVDIQQWSVGIDNELSAGIQQLEVFPNPNTGTFRLNLELVKPEAVSVYMYNMRGQQVYGKNLHRLQVYEEEIHLNGLNEGVYLLKVNTRTGIVVRRILITN